MRTMVAAGLVLSMLVTFGTAPAEAQSRAEVEQSMLRAGTFYRTQVAKHGGYVYYYSLDLQRRLGEGVAGPDQIWVQPPGTPTVGMAYLRAYAATGNSTYLDAATETAEALIYGQLASGGWTNSVNFDRSAKDLPNYRNGMGNRKGRNYSTLDDGISQSAILFLIQADAAHEFRHEKIHEAVTFALDALLMAQFPNGAFPQVWDGTRTESPPIVAASYPQYKWRTEGRIKNYWDMYTLNDDLTTYVSRTLLEAFRVYKDDRFRAALLKLGDFLILAQMPDPQPAWAQQYSSDMHPIWARKFEPPAISGRESEDAIRTLLMVHSLSGDAKYLVPIPKALAYLHGSMLSDGRLARYYELETNRPLYMSREGDVYSLTYSDANLPSHYGWKNEAHLDELDEQYRQAKNGKPVDLAPPPSAVSRGRINTILDELDDDGRWISVYDGEPLAGQPKFRPKDRYLNSGVFSENLTRLADYLESTR